MNSKFFTLFACLVSMMLLAGCKLTPEEKATKVSEHISRRLNLNDAQKADIKRLSTLAIDDFKATQADRKELAAEIEKQIVSEKVDTTEIKRLTTAQSAKRQEIMLKWIDRLAAFQATLTPEQKQKALKAMQDFRKRMESGFTD